MLFWERDRVLEATVPVLRSRCHGHLVVGGLLRDLDHGVGGDEDLGADSAETQALALALMTAHGGRRFGEGSGKWQRVRELRLGV